VGNLYLNFFTDLETLRKINFWTYSPPGCQVPALKVIPRERERERERGREREGERERGRERKSIFERILPQAAKCQL
jgi:hypothetical protein